MDDYFSLFNIPRVFSIEARMLEKKFHELQRGEHPDRFVNKSEQERSGALERSSLINKAYRTLRDPVQRRKYLAGLYGFSIEQEKSVPQDLLMKVMDAQEKIMEVKMGMGSPSNSDDLKMLSRELKARLFEMDNEITSLEVAWDSESGLQKDATESMKSNLKKLVSLIATKSYVNTLK